MSETERSRLSQDEVYDLLSNPRRRFIISYLGEHERAELQELAEQVAAWENETTPDSLTDKQQKRAYVSLYQTHVPKLEDAGIVEYDSETGEVRLLDRVEQLDRYLPGEEENGIDWRRIYLAIAVVGGVFYALIALNVPGFAAIPEGIAGALIWSAIAAIVVLQYVMERTRSSGGIDRSRRE